jgi:choline dehydrogenase
LRIRQFGFRGARWLAENPEVNVLLLEAGGGDDLPAVMDAIQWPLKLGSERDWSFQAQPNPDINGRSIPLSMGKVPWRRLEH